MKEKSLEQLHQILSKHLPIEYREALDELTRRASDKYVEAMLAEVDEKEKKPLVFPARDLQHMETYDQVIVHVRFPTKEDRERFGNPYHEKLIATRDWRPREHFLTANGLPLPTEWVIDFIPTARALCTITRDGAYSTIRHLRSIITQMQDQLKEKSILLDAWGHVWCSGGCTGGQFAHTPGTEITPELAAVAVDNVFRLLHRIGNNKWATNQWTRARVSKMMEWYESRPELKRQVEIEQAVLSELKAAVTTTNQAEGEST